MAEGWRHKGEAAPLPLPPSSPRCRHPLRPRRSAPSLSSKFLATLLRLGRCVPHALAPVGDCDQRHQRDPPCCRAAATNSLAAAAALAHRRPLVLALLLPRSSRTTTTIVDAVDDVVACPQKLHENGGRRGT